MKLLCFSLLLLFLLGPVLKGENSGADLVLTNGNIYTVDERLGRVQALAIAHGRIVAVATSEEIRHWIGPQTKVIDLEGKFVLPGFNDAHVHLAMAGQQLLSVNLEGTRSIAEFQERIRARIERTAPGAWVTGGGWDQSLWKENRMPTRADLDAVSTRHPMYFRRVGGHSAVVNSLALEMAGITRETRDPAGGIIVRNASGEPTGWLRDSATDLVRAHIPLPTLEERKRAFRAALAEAARTGVTSVQDDSIREGGEENLPALLALRAEGQLTARITEWLPFAEPLEKIRTMQESLGTEDPWLRAGALKEMADGAGGARTAAMFEAFANDPSNRGILFFEPEELKQMVIERDGAGYQIALHAIGDRAIHLVLDAYKAAQEANGRRDARHKIEHAQYVHSDDVPRFADLGVIASMQPVHLLAEIRWTRDLLGPDREYMAYAVRSLCKNGATVAFGTDFPVEHINPLRVIYAAVARELEEGGPTGGYQPQEKISVEQAIRAYTWNSAYAEFAERQKGTLAPGKYADLLVLSRDLTHITPREILETEVLLTMVGGRTVYEKKK